MDDQFFNLSKILWTLFSPGGLASIASIIALLSRLGNKPWLFKLSLYPLLTGIVLLTFIPLGNIPMYQLESSFPVNPELPGEVDGIIVLGGSVNPGLSQHWNQLEINHYAERLFYFASLAKEYPDAELIFTGGNGSMDRSRATESEALSSDLELYNIEKSRVKFEGRSRNTNENALYSSKLVETSRSPEGNWVLITSAFHMPRAVGVFCKKGINTIPFPVDHQTKSGRLFTEFQFDFIGNLNILNQAMHEWAGLLAYYFTGKTNSLIPSTCATT